MARARVLFAALALAAALPLGAAEEPEAVYAKFHRALHAADLQEMLRYATDAQRAEMAAMSPAQKSASLKMMAVMLPRAYALKDKSIAPGGQAARLALSGTAPQLIDGKPETLYGTIRMVMQRGEWKVAASDWTNTAPATSQPAAKPAARAAAAPQKATPQSRATLPVGALESAPGPKLGTQKPVCVYKPVMTAEDLEACR
jgi:hypothetical protein